MERNIFVRNRSINDEKLNINMTSIVREKKKKRLPLRSTRTHDQIEHLTVSSAFRESMQCARTLVRRRWSTLIDTPFLRRFQGRPSHYVAIRVERNRSILFLLIASYVKNCTPTSKVSLIDETKHCASLRGYKNCDRYKKRASEYTPVFISCSIHFIFIHICFSCIIGK